MTKQPHFKKINGIPTLMVNEQPYLAFAGELHNSSPSSKEYMENEVWENVDGMYVNTIVAPAYWELIESEEGVFKFDSVKDLIDQARVHQKKVILLWFGLWKNGLSTYVPSWMKTDRETYPFIQKKNGERIYSITPLCTQAVSKDALAFKALMAFLHAYDSEEQTVIMVQIENEVGALGTDFDYSSIALQTLGNEIPTTISEQLSLKGDWLTCFGTEAKEYFMAYHYARAVDRIAEAGKKAYDLPFFVNVWLEKYPARPGEYPTGGPTAKMGEFWKRMTKNIVAIAPDIYVPNFSEVCAQFSAFQDNLLIPETRQDLTTVANLLYGLAKYNINCFSPFGIEDFLKEESALDRNLLTALSIDASAFDYKKTGTILANTYKKLVPMSEMIIHYRGTEKIFPFYKEKESDRGTIFDLTNCEVKVSYQNYTEHKVRSAGFIIETSAFEFYVVGINVSLLLRANYEKSEQIGLVDFEEGYFKEGKWVRGRILNGDERYHISIGNETKIYRIVYHTY
ncbi:hypothetical protein IGK06_002756 [Enterococcus sp. AZ142]|uniref:DUF5597 domain-containing protein n=2 Tax=Enterococcus TaxID=1350 RepID=UPI003D2B2560